jgi:hypothetical protein
VDEAIVRDARQPQAAIDRDGAIHVVFGSGDSIYHAASDDAKAFGPPVKVASEGKLSLGMRRGPRIAIARGAIVISAIAGERGGGRDGDLLAWRSTDGGKSWSSSTRVNGVAGSAREGLHAMAAGEQGRVYSVWLDLRGGRTEILGSGSEDGGASWSQNKRIYRSPSGSVCECCHPSVAFGPHGTLYVMWRNSIDGLRDMFLVKSPDGGATFGQPRKLGAGSWTLDACPMDGGAIAVAPGQKITTIWRRERQVFTADSSDQETLIAQGEQPWCVATADGPYLAWLSDRPGDLWLSSPGSRLPAKVAADASDPMLAAAPGGHGPVVVVWETGGRGQGRIWAKVVPPRL